MMFLMTEVLSKQEGLADGEVYYVSYRENGFGDLSMAIVFTVNSEKHMVDVSWMAISAQGVARRLRLWEKRNPTALLKRESIFTLFSDSLKVLREWDPELESVKILIVSKGSSHAVNLLWGKGTSHYDGKAEYLDKLPYPATKKCINCQLGEAIHALQGVGGGFCSERCARGAWLVLQRLEHPLVEKFDFY